MYINKETNASYNFKAPNIPGDADKKVEVFFPTAEAVSPTISSNKAEVTVNCNMTVVDLGSVSEAPTLTLTPGADLNVGAKVVVKVASTAGSSINLTVKKDSSTTVGTVAVASNTTVVKEIVWTGSAWAIIG